MPISNNTADQLRARLNDKPKRTVQTIYGNGLDSAFELGALPGGLVSGTGQWQPSAFISGNAQWTATGCTFNYSPPLVTFSSVISANTAVMLIYNHAVFSDAEIDYITANAGDLNGCTVEGINWLMADYSRRASWAGGGVSYNDGATLNNLKTWRETLRSAMTVEQGPQGGFESWAEQQQNYPTSF